MKPDRLAGLSRLRAVLPQQGSLGRRFAAASGLTVVGTLSQQMIRLASNLILARLLVPEMFGLMMFAATLYAAIQLLTDTGIPLSIQREPGGDDPRFLRAAWTVSLLRGVVIGAGVLLGAVALGTFAPMFFASTSVYAHPDAPVLLGLIAVLPVIDGLTSSNLYLAMRNMTLGRVTSMAVFGQLMSMLSMAAFALVWPSVWALFVGMLVQAVIRVLLSHLVLPGPRMGWLWDREIIARLWRFGRWVMISTPFSFLANNIDTFLLAAFLDAATFGLYTISRLWALAGTALTGQVIRGVGWPGLSEVARDRPEDLPRILHKMLQAVDIISLVSWFVLAFGADLLIHTLYPETYHNSVIFLQILALLIAKQHFDVLRTVLLSLGQSKLIMFVSIQNALATGGGIVLCFQFLGTEAAIYAVALGHVLTAPSLIYFCRSKVPGYNPWRDILWVGIIAVMTIVTLFVI